MPADGRQGVRRGPHVSGPAKMLSSEIAERRRFEMECSLPLEPPPQAVQRTGPARYRAAIVTSVITAAMTRNITGIKSK